MQKPQRRGAELFAFQLSGKLIACGHNVSTVYLYAEKGAGLALRDNDHLLDFASGHPSEILIGRNPRIVGRLLRLMNLYHPDIIQVNGARTVKYGALLAGRSPQRRWRLVYRNIGDPAVWLRGWRRRWFYRKFVIPYVDGIVTVSAATSESLRSVYGDDRPVTVIPRGIDPEGILPRMERGRVRDLMDTPADARVMIYAGSLSPEKRIDRLLRVVARATGGMENLYLWIVGDGELRNDLLKQAKRLDVSSHVRFAGEQKDVGSYYNASDILVLSSDTEGTPGVVLEAGILGVPSIAFGVGGVPECIQNGKTGIVVRPGDEEEFTAAVVALMDSVQKRKEFGENARIWVSENFNMQSITDRYVAFYERLLGEKA